MARKIVLTSGKGGVGKTTVCANLGINLAKLGFRVVVIDVDIGLNNLDVVMGIEDQVVFDITDVIMGKCRAKQALVQDKKISSLYFLPSAHSYNNINILGEHIKNVLTMFESSFDYILIDCPAGVDAGFHRAVFPANEALIVVTPHLSSIKDAGKVVALLDEYNIESKGLIINRMRGDMLLNGDLLNIQTIVKSLNIPLLGVIPEDDQIGSTCSVGGRLQSGESARAFTLLSENIHNGSKKIYDCTYKYRGFMGYVRRNLKKRV
ncbi:MAG: septum site-determining protein MinD [Clostridiales bacterium]|nr:septum site-determining protein MinD [Clostridiales bacterium]